MHYTDTISNLVGAPTLRQTAGFGDHINTLVNNVLQVMDDNKITLSLEDREILEKLSQIHHGYACDILGGFIESNFTNLMEIIENLVLDLFSSNEEEKINIACSIEFYLLR